MTEDGRRPTCGGSTTGHWQGISACDRVEAPVLLKNTPVLQPEGATSAVDAELLH